MKLKNPLEGGQSPDTNLIASTNNALDKEPRLEIDSVWTGTGKIKGVPRGKAAMKMEKKLPMQHNAPSVCMLVRK